jgi:AcrR family transcriptional regulator
LVYRTTERGAELRAASQASILRAAGKLFAEKGYDATTMQDIVKEARTSIGNAYFYFANKEAILQSLLESAFVEMFDAAERRAEHIEDGAEKVGTIIAINATTFLTARAKMLDILTADSRLGVVQKLGDIAAQRWNRILQAAFPNRAAEELALAAVAIWGVNRSVVERAARRGTTTDTKGDVTFMVRWTLRALGIDSRRINRIVATAWRVALRHAREVETQPW